MELADWSARWRAGRIGFHQATTTDALVTYSEQTWGTAPLRRVFVPLCGKSLDLVYLAQHAAAVVGVEYVEQAVEEFFAEQGLTPHVGHGPLRPHTAGPYTLFAADFFDLSSEDVGAIDAVLDRAALVALDAGSRVRYVEHLRSLVPAGTKTLLVTFDYDQTRMDGPPFAVPDDEVRRLFAQGFVVERLDTRAVLNPRFRARGLDAMTESVFSLTRIPAATGGTGDQR